MVASVGRRTPDQQTVSLAEVEIAAPAVVAAAAPAAVVEAAALALKEAVPADAVWFVEEFPSPEMVEFARVVGWDLARQVVAAKVGADPSTAALLFSEYGAEDGEAYDRFWSGEYDHD